MSRAVQKQIERSYQKARGDKRVEVVLDAFAAGCLEDLKRAKGMTTREAVDYAITSAGSRYKPQPF